MAEGCLFKCRSWFSFAALLLLLLYSGLAHAEEGPVGKVSAAMGQNYVLRNGEKISTSRGMELYRSDQLVTGAGGVVKIVFADGSSIVAMKNSSFEIEEYQARASGKKVTLESVMGLVRGKIKVLVKPRDGGHNAVVKTQNAVMGVRGTEFIVSYLEPPADAQQPEPAQTQLVVIEGKVALRTLAAAGDDTGGPASAQRDQGVRPDPLKLQQGEVLVAAGQAARVVADEKPGAPVAVPPNYTESLQVDVTDLAGQPEIPAEQIVADIKLPPPVAETKPLSRALQQGGDPLVVDLFEKGRGSGDQAGPARAGADGAQNPEGVGRAVGAGQRPVVIFPRGATLLTEVGLSCDEASLQLLRHAAQTFDPEADVLVQKLMPCEALQDEVMVWGYFYFTARGAHERAMRFTQAYREQRQSMDLDTDREVLLRAMRQRKLKPFERAGAGKATTADRGHLLLAARAHVIAGKAAAARALYDSAARVPSWEGNAGVYIEKGYVLLLSGPAGKPHDEAASLFRQLLRHDLDEEQERACRRGLELATRKSWDHTGEVRDVFARIFSRARTAEGGYQLLGWGLSWQGEQFFAEAGHARVAWKNNADLELFYPRVLPQKSRGRSDVDLAHFGGGARYIFSTGASAQARATVYGDQDVRFGGELLGRYPFLGDYAAFLNLSYLPQHEEFMAALFQRERSTLRLGGGLTAFNKFTYSLTLRNRDDEGTALTHFLSARVPLHRGASEGNVFDLLADVRHHVGGEGADPTGATALERGLSTGPVKTDPFNFSPAQETEVRGGGHVGWKWGALSLKTEVLFGYLTRDTRPDDFVGLDESRLPPWLKRERVPAELTTAGLMGIGCELSTGFRTGLDVRAEHASGIDSDFSDLQVQGLMTFDWNYSAGP